ncbi:MAG: hypothetical protein L6R38_002034 [Xanthoria sp. 2 TBL-2021]|nr:MAG: hypothetical protein L6R38_002034 [Xanthoria sp. 2 TBL-2021]
MEESRVTTKKHEASFVPIHKPIILASPSQFPPFPQKSSYTRTLLAGPNPHTEFSNRIVPSPTFLTTTKKNIKMGSSHSKPKKPVRKPQISYPRAQAHSAPLHAYGHLHPSRPQQQQSHHNLHHPAEPQYYGNSPAVHYGNRKVVSVSAPEVKYYGTFPAAAPSKKGTQTQGKQQGPVRRKPVPPPSRAQVNYYSKRALPPVPGSRAAVKSVRVQYGYC